MNKQDHKYGTAEYSLCEASEKIVQAFAQVQAVRKEIGQIVPVGQIVFRNDRFKGGNVGGRLEWYFNFGEYSRWGPSFDEANAGHIERAYENAMKFVATAEQTIEDWHAENLPAIANNQKVADDIKSFMETVGISPTYYGSEVVRKQTKSVTKSAGYMLDIDRCCIRGDGYSSAKTQLKQHKESLTLAKDQYLKKIAATKAAKEKEDGHLRKIAKAMELYSSLGLTEPYTTNDQLLDMVNEPAQEAWVKENYPDGEPVHIKCCDSCSEWIVGERRCSCGNRRIELSVEGDFFTGFSAFPSAY